jgi:competence protein ComEC
MVVKGLFLSSKLLRRADRPMLIAVVCLAFLVGLALAAAGWRFPEWCGVCAILVVTPFFMKRAMLVAIVIAAFVGVVVGIWRGASVIGDLGIYSKLVGVKVEVVGDVVEDAVYNTGQLDFRIVNVKLDGQQLPGQIRVKTFSPFASKRGDRVRVGGKLYGGFGNYQASIYYASVLTEAKNGGWLEDLRRNFAASVYTNLPDPQASLGLGFLVGIKSQLPVTLNDQLKILGLTHIVVASGYNLTVLVRLAKRLLEKRSKFQMAAMAAGLIAGFVAVTGFSPSMSRAALVASMSLAAWYWGRRIPPAVILLFSAAVTAGVYPPYLWSDIGWWLSFLAFAGVMLLAPLLQRRLFDDTQPKLLAQIILETISAQLLTLPLLLFVFGSLSVIALPANVIVVPLIPLAMLFTFVAGASGLLLPWVAPLLAIPATVLLSYVTDLVSLMSQVSWASVPFSIGISAMVSCYAVIIVVGLILWRRTKYDFLSGNLVE